MLPELTVTITILSFLFTLLYIFWRPHVNEAIPATVGAIFVILSGSVSFSDLGVIADTVGGAAITIIATIVMAIVLESFGFFYWAAAKLVGAAKGSGLRLFWLVNLFCFLMTLFVNNDGSILITTPILLMVLNHFQLKNHQKIPYLLSGALVATASSAPIGVSNIVNLISLKVVDLDLYRHTAMMFVPATLGLLMLLVLLYIYFYKSLPRKIPTNITNYWVATERYHPLKGTKPFPTSPDQGKFMLTILFFVLGVRIGLFVASYFHIPVALAAVFGSLILLAWRWYRLKISPLDMWNKIPWHILIFAFSMYVMIYGLHNIGLTQWLIHILQPIVARGLFSATVMMGLLVSLLSNFFNNHPALMIGTMTLTNMELEPFMLQISYLASVIGSDMGSLVLPIGTLATLLWMHIIKKGKVKFTWRDYIKVTFLVIPVTTVFTLIVLVYWVSWIF